MALVTLQDSGGTAVFTLQNLAFGAGRISPRIDRGVGALPAIHFLLAKFQFETAAVIGTDVVYLYLSQSDGTLAVGTPGTADAALTSDKRRNLLVLGQVVADTVGVATDIIGGWPFMIYTRYYNIGVWNGSAGDNLENTANANSLAIYSFP